MCSHRNLDSTVLLVPPESTGTLHLAVVTVRCLDCGTPFEFVGIPEGTKEWRVGLHGDKREVWLQMQPADAPKVQ